MPGASASNEVRISGLRKSFGVNEVLRGIDLTFKAGEATVLMGPSGSGKTTLLRCVNALEEFQAGSIHVGGRPMGYVEKGGRRVRISERERAKARADVAIVFQSYNLFPHMTALANVCLGPIRVRGLSRADALRRGRDVLTRVGLADKFDSFPSQLSGGQQQRVAIARAMAMEPLVMLFDEVTSALDPELIGEVLAVIRELAMTHGVTMIIVTHEMQFAREVADQVVFLDQGQVAEVGEPASLFTTPKTERLRSFLRRFNMAPLD